MTTCRRAWRNAGLLLLLAVMLPLLLMRISLESSLWSDEIYSIQMAEMPVPEMIDRTLLDFHPPGYYLVLKGWLALGKSIGLEPGVLWGRLPGVIGWLGLVAAAWFLGAKAFGRRTALLLVWSIAIAGQTGSALKDMRAYALAYPALLICFMLLFALRSQAKQSLGWILYFICASFALWSQMLTGPVLGLLAIMWLAIGLSLRGPRRKTYLIQGFVAQAAALISFLPWIPQLDPGIVGNLEARRAWMTPPTVSNWLRVFGLWYPFGRRGGEEAWGFKFGLQAALGFMTLAVPLTGLAWGRLRQNHRVPRAWKRLAVWGIALAITNVTILWALDRSGAMVVFHGPRYMLFTAAIWACGLTGLSHCARIKSGWRPWTAWVLMSPWLICSVIGLDMDLDAEMSQGNIALTRKWTNPMPPVDEPLYVIPSELLPFQKQILAEWDARPIEDIAAIPRQVDHASILVMNSWFDLTSERDMLVQSLLEKGSLAKAVTPHHLPPMVTCLDYYTLFDARGWNHECARQLARDGFRAKSPPVPPQAIARVDARELRMHDGWYILQADDDLQRYRWSSAAMTKVSLPPLEPGRYTLHFTGARWHTFAGPTRLAIQPPGSGPLAATEVATQSFEVTVPFELATAEPRPLVRLNHPVINMNAGKPYPASWAGIAFYRLWVERAL